jgi:hypothetical protein
MDKQVPRQWQQLPIQLPIGTIRPSIVSLLAYVTPPVTSISEGVVCTRDLWFVQGAGSCGWPSKAERWCQTCCNNRYWQAGGQQHHTQHVSRWLLCTVRQQTRSHQ